MLVSRLNHKIFQTSIFFETNKFHHGGPHGAHFTMGGPHGVVCVCSQARN